MRRLIIAMIVLGCIASGANSQQNLSTQQQAWLERDFPTLKDTIDEVRQIFRPQLPKDQQELMDSIVVSVRRADWDIFNVYAIAPPHVAQRAIVLSAGALFIYDLANRAMAEASELQDMDAYGGYLAELTDHIQAATTSIAGGQTFPVMPGYCEFRKHSDAECAALRARPTYKIGLDLLKSGSIGLIFAHELGHHVFYHDKQPTRPRIEKETEADDFALKLMIRSDLNPAAAYGVFLMFASFEGAPPDKPQERTRHPYAACRFFKAYKLAYFELLKDPLYIVYLKQRGILQEVRDASHEFIASLDKMKCN